MSCSFAAAKTNCNFKDLGKCQTLELLKDLLCCACKMTGHNHIFIHMVSDTMCSIYKDNTKGKSRIIEMSS